MCKITKIDEASRYRKSVCFLFTYHDKEYTDCELYTVSLNLEGKLQGVQIPIIVLKDKPDTHKLLLYKNDYSSYGLDCPDSLIGIDKLR